MAHSSIPQPASEVEAVQSAEAYLERVLASINDQFLVLDSEWRYTYVNDRVVETVGMSREDLLGHCIWDIFPDLVGTQFHTRSSSGHGYADNDLV
jgi:PAS domain S-box-containing protein